MTRKSRSARYWVREKEAESKKIRQELIRAQLAKEFLKNLSERDSER